MARPILESRQAVVGPLQSFQSGDGVSHTEKCSASAGSALIFLIPDSEIPEISRDLIGETLNFLRISFVPFKCDHPV